MRVSDCPRRIVRSVCLAAVALLCATSLCSIARADLMTGLTTYYNFNENTGTTVYDTATSGVSTDNGVFVTSGSGGGVSWISGKFGSGLQIVNNTSSSGNYVQFGTAASPYYDINNQGSTLTMGMWINLAYVPSASMTTDRAIWGGNLDNYNLYESTASELRMKVQNASSQAARPGIAASALSTGSWHYLTATFDGTGSVGVAKIYWDGILKDTHTGNDVLSNGSWVSGTTGLTGKIKASAQAYYLGHNGTTNDCSFAIDDFGIWDRVLTTDEITTLASGVSPIPEPSTFILLSVGLLSLIAYAWRKRK